MNTPAPSQEPTPSGAGTEAPPPAGAAKHKAVERLFPFVLKSRGLIVGRQTLARSKSRLHFVLITEDISDGSRTEVLSDFKHYPVVQRYTAAALELFFNIHGAKIVGFVKSGLAQSIYAELKPYRINQPVRIAKPSEAPSTPPSRDGTDRRPRFRRKPGTVSDKHS